MLDIDKIVTECIENNTVITNSTYDNNELYYILGTIFLFCDTEHQKPPDLFLTDCPDIFKIEKIRQPVHVLTKSQRFEILLKFDELDGWLPAVVHTTGKPPIEKYTEPIIIFRCNNKYYLGLVRLNNA